MRVDRFVSGLSNYKLLQAVHVYIVFLLAEKS